MTDRRLAVVMSVDVVGFSRMMQGDARGLLKALNGIFRGIIRPAVAANGGRVVKLVGDGALVEFRSAHDGLGCAVAIQRAMAEAGTGFSEPIRLRIGMHVGDVLADGDDVFGDCVNVVARLQTAAAPGGILISGTLGDLVGGTPGWQLSSEGRHTFKNISRPVETFSVSFRTVEPSEVAAAELAKQQQVRFCRAADGIALAWTATGRGATVVKPPNWITHLELDWRTPHTRGWLASLSARYRLVRFDARGNSMSSREVADVSFDRFVDDLECVFDAAGVERAPIFAISQGCAIAAAFAARAPERVSGIVMLGGYAQGRKHRPSPKSRAEADALGAMIDAGWDDPFPSLRDLFAERIVPLASVEERREFAEDMRQMCSGEMLVRYREAIETMDVTGLLPEVRAPCLVLHCRGDRMQPVEQGQLLAAGIPDARFIAYESSNHVFTDNDPCWPAAEHDIRTFLDDVARS